MANMRRTPILLGPGQSVSMGNVPMHDQVARYLHRLRYTLPFPCSPEETYFGLVPPTIKKWHQDGLFDVDLPLPGRASNFVHTIKQQAPQSRYGSVLHVCIESQARYLDALHGVRGFEGVFWFSPPAGVPIPYDSTASPFFLNDDHPHAQMIHEWASRAFELQDEIEATLRTIDTYSQVVTTAAQVRHTWPELINFVTFKRMHDRLPRSELELLRIKMPRSITRIERDRVIEQLSTAVMLPEKSPPLTAWVHFYNSAERYSP